MLQFGTMCLDMLEMRVGNLPGMSLLWGFLSHSETVVMVSGWLEVIGSLLLLFRKTDNEFRMKGLCVERALCNLQV